MRHCLVLLCLAGCFRDPDGAASPIELRLSDLAGVLAAPEEAPRDLELSLSFAGAPDDKAPLLMRGHVDAELLPRLSFARPNAALAAQLVTLDVERAPHALRSRTQQPLAAGRYTLVWPYGSEPRAFPFVVSASPAFGARWVESSPGAGASQVPANLAHVLVRFDGHVQGSLASALHGDGFGVRVDRCAAYGLPEGDCAWLTPTALAAGQHEIVLEPGLFTPSGAAIPSQRVSFEVAATVDTAPPALMAAHCALDEKSFGGACVRSDDEQLWVHGLTSEASAVTLLAGNARAMTISYAGEFALALAPHDPRGVATLRLADLAGNVSELALSYELAALAELALEEARPDPLGPEPAQEYVELLNFGHETVALMGFTLSTDAFEKGRTIASGTLAPGERALLVGPDFDARDSQDGVLPSGVKVIPLSGALGLANSGGALFLRDALGRRLAAGHSIAPLIEGQCSRRVGELRDGAWELDAHGSCTPGADSP